MEWRVEGAEQSTVLSASGEHDLPSVADLMAAAGIVPSKSAARRAIAEGGAYLNNRRVSSEDAVPDRRDLLRGRYLILRRGKRTVGAVQITADDGDSGT